MSPSPAVADLIASLAHPGGIHPALARQVSAQLALLEAPSRPSHGARRISPFPARRLARSRNARPARFRLPAPGPHVPSQRRLG